MILSRHTQKGRSLLLALLLALLSVPLAGGCKDRSTDEPPGKAATEGQKPPLTLAFPTNGAYAGAYVDFGEGESHVTYDALTDFEQMTGKHIAAVAFGNFWGDQEFPARTVKIIYAYGAVPLLFWSPWDKPYMESRGPDRFSLTEILAGKWDAYIDAWADQAREFGKPLLVAWGIEMNGTWFPWSGNFYDGGKVIGRNNGLPLYQGPELYKKAYRHVVDRVRARHADNILWGFHVNNFSSPRADWNRFAQYYPGSGYVDWLGMSLYGKMHRKEGWAKFTDMMNEPYEEICRLDADKPVFLAEWGVGEFPPEDKAGFITQALTLVPQRYPRVRLAVYWHERWENEDGTFSNLRVNSSPAALKAYRQGISSPYWLDRPQFVPRPPAR